MARDESPNMHTLHDMLITANHILHSQNVVDAYGHISVRHPSNPDIYIMSASVAPGTVSSASDLVEYRVKDSSPVDPDAKKGYQERFIHSEIYRLYGDVGSVVHSHSENVLPFAALRGVGMRPVFHIAGFLGNHVPVYNILEFYPEDATQDMLVNTLPLGTSLAAKFSSSPSNFSETTNETKLKSSPDHKVVVMQNHGFTTWGENIQQAVFRAVYTHVNASIQMKAITLNAAVGGRSEDVVYLDERQAVGCEAMGVNSVERPWSLWVKEVEANPLYARTR